MLSIVTAPEWSRPSAAGLGIEGPPDDLNAYAKFVGEVVDRYKGKVHAIEIWNEQNIDAEWKTNPQVVSPEKYVEMLKLAYETIKAKDPNIVVISGALSPTGYFLAAVQTGATTAPQKRVVDAAR
jgi:GH35 family endo-1,4-beta-xylanase